jgi:hypothetical protein
MGNSRNGWVVIGPRCAGDLVGKNVDVLEDNHILTGLSGFPITSHSPSSSDICGAGLEQKLMPRNPNSQRTFPFGLTFRASSVEIRNDKMESVTNKTISCPMVGASFNPSSETWRRHPKF